MSTEPKRPRYWWESFSPDAARAGAELAVLRRGIGKEAGSVPEMWRFHRASLDSYEADTGLPSARLRAEHTALTLFAVHQQSQRKSMHQEKTGLGQALRRLRQSDKYKSNPETLDTRVNVLATSFDVAELAHHLRGLTTLLRGIQQPLDYTRLYYDVLGWHSPEGQDRARRRWGAQYYDWADAKPQPRTSA
ncbi:type I-E CRISPR-associated protein Cse2/CasB [Streptomyces bluensis]|uniref:Type I-E CRISPR-associated protein Cse2/CasB n=1 Tax=Streptomyces bluensis TaxID=33897 RepID=A0ABW6ULM7_9ACTN